jgi:hypothetical protein
LHRQTRQPISGYVIGNRQMAELAREFGRRDDTVTAATARGLPRGHRRQSLDRATSRPGPPRAALRGPKSSVAKLAIANLARRSRDLALDLLGAHGMLSDGDAPYDGAVQHVALSSPAPAWAAEPTRSSET